MSAFRGPRFRGSPGAVIPAGTYAELVDDAGNVRARLSPTFRDQSDPPPGIGPGLRTPRGEQYATVSGADGPLRYRVLATPLPGRQGALVVALPLREVDQTLRRMVAIELVVTTAVLALLGALGQWVVRVGLQPLANIEKTAAAIAGGGLSRRVERAEDRTEVGRLGLSLNAMLSRIEGAFEEKAASARRLRQFVADASHELRTPLTSIRGYAELFRRGADRRPEDLATAMRRIEEEAERWGCWSTTFCCWPAWTRGAPWNAPPSTSVVWLRTPSPTPVPSTRPGRSRSATARG